ncbi:MAG: DUF2185 domain-containing protein [Terracidiphilus sp.]|jgi:hypothetical protein
MEKLFKLRSDQFHPLAEGRGSCIATDRITVDGLRVGYMYREAPYDAIDSGWHFFSGDESRGYCDNSKNLEIYNVNTIANYGPEIIPFLDKAIGTSWIRNKSGKFIEDVRCPIE